MFSKFISKYNLAGIMNRIFTKSNLSKIIIIFSVGLITRIIISYSYNINVFIELFNRISLIYYSFMAIFVVVLNEVFTYFDLNIFPKFMIEYCTKFIELSILIYKYIRHVSYKIYNLKFSDFSFESIVLTIKKVLYSYIFDQNKLTIGNVESNKVDKPFKINFVLNKDGDNITLPNRTYNAQYPQSSAQNVSSNSAQNVSSNLAPSNSSTSNSSDKTLPFVFRGNLSDLNDTNSRRISSNAENIERYPSSSVYSEDLPRQVAANNRISQNFDLYDAPSNFSTPSTMTPLFGNSQLNIDRITALNNQNNSLIPYPLNITGRADIEQNSRSSSFIERPYDLSGNGVLPNVTFNSVSQVRGNIPLNNGLVQNRNLPLLPNNYENNLDNIADTPRIDDPCSINYQSRHKPLLTTQELTYDQRYNNTNITQLSHEVIINKEGIKGKVKLVFKNLGSQFTNGIKKIESAYIKYETVSRRHIIWSLIEENSGRYESYDDFKKEWDSKKSIWQEIKERTRQDLKSTIEGSLGLRNNRPTIERNINREIEDLLQSNHPFDKSNRPEVNKGKSNVVKPKESINKLEEGIDDKIRHRKGSHSRRHKYSHRHHSSRHKRY